MGCCRVTYSFSANWWRVSFCFHVFFWKVSYKLFMLHIFTIFGKSWFQSCRQISFSIKKSSFTFMIYLWEESNQNSLTFYFSVLTKLSCIYLAARFFLNLLTSLPVHIEYGGMKTLPRIPAGIFLEPCWFAVADSGNSDLIYLPLVATCLQWH